MAVRLQNLTIPFCPIILIVDHVLKQILPPGVEVPSSFETIVKYSTVYQLELFICLFLFYLSWACVYLILLVFFHNIM